RVVTDEGPPPLMDHDELVVANYRGLRVLRYVLGPLHTVWREAMAEAVSLLEPEERAAVRQALSEGLALVETADRGRVTRSLARGTRGAHGVSTAVGRAHGLGVRLARDAHGAAVHRDPRARRVAARHGVAVGDGPGRELRHQRPRRTLAGPRA